jgi:hypothetical protein
VLFNIFTTPLKQIFDSYIIPFNLKKDNKKMLERLQIDYKQLVYKMLENKRKISLIY